MIDCQSLSFAYADKTILQNISFQAKPGEFICLLGASGCGKSTLLRLIAGLEQPSAGHIAIDGHNTNGPNQNCAVVFQDYSLFPWMSTADNLILALKAAYPNRTRRELAALAEDYLATVGLADAANRYPEELSGGMRQRAAIARALALPTPILLMDEPFGALDPINRTLLQDLLRKLHDDARQSRTVLFVTHDLDEALFLATRIIALASSPGRIIADVDNSPARHLSHQQLLQDPDTRQRRQRLLDAYQSDILARLDARTSLQPGDGI
ncbi:MAG: ABC transporter ATP-binding protein [Oligosphaeraceae bacterium]